MADSFKSICIFLGIDQLVLGKIDLNTNVNLVDANFVEYVFHVLDIESIYFTHVTHNHSVQLLFPSFFMFLLLIAVLI